MAKFKDTDYLSISARVRYLETKLLRRDSFEKMAEAADDEEALRVLTDAGYSGAVSDPRDFETLLDAEQMSVYGFIAENVKNSIVTDVLRLPYDYMNIKAVLKAAIAGVSPDRMLIGGGTVQKNAMCDAINTRDKGILDGKMLEAVSEASQQSSVTGDPQLIDLICDRKCFEDIFERADNAGYGFITDYMTAKVDLINIVSFMRLRKTNRDEAFFKKVFIPSTHGLKYGFFSPLFQKPFQEFMDSLRDTSYSALPEMLGTADIPRMSDAERTVKQILDLRASSMRSVSFGPQVPFAYLLSKEDEIRNARIVMSGRLSGLRADKITERLSASNV